MSFTADFFVPCGGRPEAINISNVDSVFVNGKPMFKYIVEGANLFFTQEARAKLEEAGVVIFKDASANKGGVTSSSLEVLAALCLNNQEFEEHMCVKNGVAPEFYKSYVVDVQNTIESNARQELSVISFPILPELFFFAFLPEKLGGSFSLLKFLFFLPWNLFVFP